MAFPAVTVAPDAIPPWAHFMRTVLNGARVDCFGKEESCRAPEKLREDLGRVIDANVRWAFDKAKLVLGTYSTLEANRNLFSRQSCDQMSKILGSSHADSLLLALATILSPSKASWTLQDLAVNTFRKPSGQMFQIIEAALQEHATNISKVSISPCQHLLSQTLDKEVFDSLAAWTFSQGGPSPDVRLGELVWSAQLQASFHNNRDAAGEMARVWQRLEPAFRALEVQSERLHVASIYRYVTDDEMSSDGSVVIGEWNCTLTPADVRPSCLSATSPGCCDLEREVSRSYRQVLKNMKYYPEMLFRTEEAANRDDVRAALENLDYEMLSDDAFVHPLPVVLSGKFFGRPAMSDPPAHDGTGAAGSAGEDEPLFWRGFSTSQGLVHTFNPAPFWSTFRRSEAMRTFHEEVHLKFGNGDDEERTTVRHPESNGPKYSLETFVLAKPSHGVLVTVHDPRLLPDFEENPIQVFPGKTYLVSVTPSLIVVDKGLGSREPAYKECRSGGDPHNLTLFNEYSLSACSFECRMGRAAEACGCVPWDYPQFRPGLPVCHFNGRYCFQAEMTRALSPSQCSCLPDCDRIEYATSITVKDTRMSEVCSSFPYRGIRQPPWTRDEFNHLYKKKKLHLQIRS